MGSAGHLIGESHWGIVLKSECRQTGMHVFSQSHGQEYSEQHRGGQNLGPQTGGGRMESSSGVETNGDYFLTQAVAAGVCSL